MRQHIINLIKNHKKKTIGIGIVFLLLLVILVIVIPKAFSQEVAIKSINITSTKTSYINEEGGSWNIEKSAEWTGYKKARVTFDVDTVELTDNKYTDIIFVIDVSGSMKGTKLETVKSDAAELTESLLSNSNNRAALITFDSTSSIVIGELTNDKETLLTAINDLSTAGTTNYYQALKNVENIMDGYQKEEGREVIVLFLTDGYPNVNTPNEVGEYEYLKQAYPYMTINGIQYEMGSSILDPIKKISDNQFIANLDNLENVLFEASASPANYDKFQIVDYINNEFFDIDSIDNITVSIGEVSLEGNKVTWDLAPFRSGVSATMTIDITLKNEFTEVDGYYPTNKGEEVKTKIYGIPDEDVETPNTPVLKGKHNVIYEGNNPSCNNIKVPNTESYSVFSTVAISSDIPVCEGWQFKGWEIVTDVTKVNDDYFIMPFEDVIIRAIWSKISIVKSMEGEVYTVPYLYSLIAKQSVPDNIPSTYVTGASGIDFSAISSDTNGKGVYQLSDTANDEYPVYYYRGAVDNNNLIYAGFCWKIVRTTETGGTKLIYNGVASTNGSCNNTGTDAQIGTSKFASTASLDHLGYMYGTAYIYSTKGIGTSYWYNYAEKTRDRKEIISENKSMSSTSYYYGTSFTYDTESNQYTLVGAVKQTWSKALIGYYTCFSSSYTCSTLYYIEVGKGGSSSYAYYRSLTNGVLPDGIFSKNVSYDSATGMYTLSSDESDIKYLRNFSENYVPYRYYYFCEDYSTTCANVYYIDQSYYTSPYVVTFSNGETYDNVAEDLTNNYKWQYGNSVRYENGNYTLVDTIEVEPMQWSTKYSTLNNNHYTCFSTSGTCTNGEVYYIYNTSQNIAYYITLKEGKTVEDALDEMLGENKTNSTIKTTVDNWYKENILGKEEVSYLEDTVWCNDRSVYNYGSWNPNGGSTTDYLYSSPYNRYKTGTANLGCSKVSDRFTTESKYDEEGNKLTNGDLTYPAGLLTADEVMLAGGLNAANTSYYLYNGQQYMTMSIYSWNTSASSNFAYVFIVNSDGCLSNSNVNSAIGVRPSVSLGSYVIVTAGDGTANNPYQVAKLEE